ncbi:hypothetical protein Q4574_14575 [Aliiglaciecola sp. 3_MG-2023]|uniref:hypothetical protein n=1 Tax=Aliiglaciecola sp. 3_MG-2023 TaxID=3062644 RepID=UPI0026E415C0|nr:hypothetical protein [Aliiglaciecola sp. 3_MG-2023]MDO6694518.1 hypothetical protein [Aliiglaciecola sp. 3_MG-2023]
MDPKLIQLTLQISRENSIIEKAGKSADFTKLIKLVKTHIALSDKLGLTSAFADNLEQLEKLEGKLKRYRVTGEFCNDLHFK